MTRKFLTPIVLPADPAAAMEAATKQYVDGKLVGGGGTDEVWIGPDEPVDPALELWYDTDDTTSGAGGWNTAWGVVASGIRTTSATAIGGGAYVDVAEMAATFTAVAGRRYVATALFVGVYSGAVDWFAVRLQNGTTTLSGTQSTVYGPAGSQVSVTCKTPPTTFAAGAVTIKTAVYFGSGPGSLPAGPDTPNFIIVEDVGPAVASATIAPTPIMQWNAAWGVVAVGTMKPAAVTVPASAWTPITEPLPFTGLVGRRYVLRGNSRAIAASGATVGAMTAVYANGTQWWDSHTPNISGVYNNSPINAYFVGDGVTRSFDLRFSSGTATSVFTDQQSSYFLIEDVGPVAGAVAIETPNPQQVYRAKPAASIAVTAAMGQTNVTVLTVPAAAVPLGRVVVVHFNTVVTQTAAAVFDAVAWVNGTGVMMRQGSTTAAGEVVNYSTVFVGTGADLVLAVSINAWGGQTVTAWPSSSIIAMICAGV